MTDPRPYPASFNRPADVAAEIGCSERALRKLARDIGACRIIGKTMVLLDEDVRAILEAMRPCPSRWGGVTHGQRYDKSAGNASPAPRFASFGVRRSLQVRAVTGRNAKRTRRVKWHKTDAARSPRVLVGLWLGVW